MTLFFTYEQILRLLQEVKILKLHIGIHQEANVTTTYSNKTPTDVYNLLNLISHNFDMINGKKFTPSYTFSETIRIYEDFQAIFNQLKLDDQTTPPAKDENAQAKDSYSIALELLNNIKKIELNAGIESINFYNFQREEVTPNDVFEITQIILAQLQVIKAHIGLTHTITRGAKRYRAKQSADVVQMLGWLLKKSHQLTLSRKVR